MANTIKVDGHVSLLFFMGIKTSLNMISGSFSKDLEAKKRGVKTPELYGLLAKIPLYLKLNNENRIVFDEEPDLNQLIKRLVELGIPRRKAEKLKSIPEESVWKIFKKDKMGRRIVQVSSLEDAGYNFEIYESDTKKSDSFLNSPKSKKYINVWVKKENRTFKEVSGLADMLFVSGIILNRLEKETGDSEKAYKAVNISRSTLMSVSGFASEKITRIKRMMAESMDIKISHSKGETEYYANKKEADLAKNSYRDRGVYCESGQFKGRYWVRPVNSDSFQFGTDTPFTETKVSHKSVSESLKRAKGKERAELKRKLYRQKKLYISPERVKDKLFGENVMKLLAKASKGRIEKRNENFSKRRGGTYYKREVLKRVEALLSRLKGSGVSLSDFTIQTEDGKIKAIWSAVEGFESRPEPGKGSIGYDSDGSFAFIGETRIPMEGDLTYIIKEGEIVEIGKAEEKAVREKMKNIFSSYAESLRFSIGKDEKENSIGKQGTSRGQKPGSRQPVYGEEAARAARLSAWYKKFRSRVEHGYDSSLSRVQGGEAKIKSLFLQILSDRGGNEEAYAAMSEEFRLLSKQDIPGTEKARRMLQDYAEEEELECLYYLLMKELVIGEYSVRPYWWTEERFSEFISSRRKEFREKKDKREYARRERSEMARLESFRILRESIKEEGVGAANRIIREFKRSKFLKGKKISKFIRWFESSYIGLKEEAHQIRMSREVQDHDYRVDLQQIRQKEKRSQKVIQLSVACNPSMGWSFQGAETMSGHSYANYTQEQIEGMKPEGAIKEATSGMTSPMFV